MAALAIAPCLIGPCTALVIDVVQLVFGGMCGVGEVRGGGGGNETKKVR